MNKSTAEKDRQSTIRIDKRSEDPFARVPKTITENPELSLQAKGLMAYLLGKPGNWRMNVTDICKRSKVKEHTARKTIQELRDAGYIKLTKEKEDGGKIVRWVYLVSDSPIYIKTAKKPDVEIHDLETDIVKKPHLARHDVNKNEGTSNKKEPPAQGRAKEFIGMWVDAYLEKQGQAYDVDGKDAGQAAIYFKRNTTPPGELILLAKLAWSRRRTNKSRCPIHIDNSISIAGFLTNVRKLKLDFPTAITHTATPQDNDNDNDNEHDSTAWT